jgi:ABC-2 type transport system permease protein
MFSIGVNLLKTKALKLRMLDKGKIKNNRLFIVLVNILLPLLLLLFFAVFYNLNQKKKYA